MRLYSYGGSNLCFMPTRAFCREVRHLQKRSVCSEFPPKNVHLPEGDAQRNIVAATRFQERSAKRFKKDIEAQAQARETQRLPQDHGSNGTLQSGEA
eukprot:CAMPEP_0203910786 /NCGR_PEP_ID=MMETSP0359-20131031/52018_1 /ASSEMBLY_ACC=CAM_ASM_000338 /TAXON_ID=268821 /ORGANISM="Scrippsiella Hangoei, Strain SHTV-5" /LENGTH=96 /DNA_ID=CAMNT_0050836341 /DNA_START=1 /DNA_END=291 /DNA_ORIENTATION=+